MPHSGRNRPQAGRISFLQERRSRPEKSDFRLESSGPERKVPGQKNRLWPAEKSFPGRGGDVLARRRKFWAGEYAPGE